MFNIGFTEFLAIGVIALLVIGPKQLPEVARIVGRMLGEFKKATQELSGGLLEVTQEVKDSIDETKNQIMKESRKVTDSVGDAIKDAAKAPSAAVEPPEQEKQNGKQS